MMTLGGTATLRSRLILVALTVTVFAAARAGGSDSSHPAAAAAPEEAKDTRPVVRLLVKNEYRREDKIFPEVLAGRMISDLGDMETFRMVSHEKPGDYLLTCTIRSLVAEEGTYYDSSHGDPEMDGKSAAKQGLTASLDLDLALEDAAGKTIYTGKLSVSASQEIKQSSERAGQLVSQELIDRAAQKLERLLRKKLPKS